MKSPALLRFSPAILLLLAGCAGQPSLNLGQPGKSFAYGAGTPAFDMEVVPMAGGLEVLLSIPPASLTFVRAEGRFRAISEISVRLQDAAVSSLVNDVAWAESTFAASYDQTQQNDPLIVSRTLPAPPGEYLLVAALEDRANGRSQTRSQPVHVPDPISARPTLGRILLQARGVGGGNAPVIPFHIPAGLSGLQCVTPVYGFTRTGRAVAATVLERFKLDQQPALPPSAFALIPETSTPRRIWFDEPETLRVRQDTLSAGAGAIAPMRLQDFPPGLYRVGVTARFSFQDGGDTVLSASRVFSLKPSGFPRPSTMQDLLAAMVYIATEKERQRILRVRGSDQARALFDSLWLSYCPERGGASGLLRRYYTRVEEANRQYTDLKEGWKTDRGMLYIVLGPPVEIMNTLDRQTWYYDLPGSQQSNAFLFKRYVIGEGETSIMTYALYRDITYERLWDIMIQRWRRCDGG